MKNYQAYNENLFKEKFNIKDIAIPTEKRVKHRILMKINESLWRKGLEIR
jgi:hypothetical protein